MTAHSMTRMTEARARTLEWIQALDDDAFCAWPDPDFSPIGWHVGHLAFTEASWVLERLLGDARLSAPYATRFAQDGRPKHERAEGLTRDELLAYLATVRAAVHEAWPRLDGSNELVRDGYLDWFLACHEHQHRETIAIVRARGVAATTPPPLCAVSRDVEPAKRIEIAAERVRIGTDERLAYDNERPSVEVEVGPFAIDARPVTSGEWLEFLGDDGHRREELWTEEGWRWLARTRTRAPSSWRVIENDSFAPTEARPIDDVRAVATPAGWRAFDPSAPVFGISAHEADAYARWRGARLPTENEWELAASVLPHEPSIVRSPFTNELVVDRIWEWTADWFLPRPGFRPFPYRGYSEPWFGDHRVMKGGSFVTDSEIARRGFRNFYSPETRACFVGLRLAWSLRR